MYLIRLHTLREFNLSFYSGWPCYHPRRCFFVHKLWHRTADFVVWSILPVVFTYTLHIMWILLTICVFHSSCLCAVLYPCSSLWNHHRRAPRLKVHPIRSLRLLVYSSDWMRRKRMRRKRFLIVSSMNNPSRQHPVSLKLRRRSGRNKVISIAGMTKKKRRKMRKFMRKRKYLMRILGAPDTILRILVGRKEGRWMCRTGQTRHRHRRQRQRRRV